MCVRDMTAESACTRPRTSVLRTHTHRIKNYTILGHIEVSFWPHSIRVFHSTHSRPANRIDYKYMY